MTEVWVDTDFGFDDLWALLLLRHLGCPVAGVSLVAGNARMPVVAANALGAKRAYGFDWPLWIGASEPVEGPLQTAERILGPTGMRSRGARLPEADASLVPGGAVKALGEWLSSDVTDTRSVLALGPLTNVAMLIDGAPEAAHRISRLVWMGGSAGEGNHTPHAEFNALADVEALSRVIEAGIPLDVVDLTFCRKARFGAADMPQTDTLTGDLLGGYLDIALERGRSTMAIYDPIAALAIAVPESISFSPCRVAVSRSRDETYGATHISIGSGGAARLATSASADLVRACLGALRKEGLHGSR